MSRRICVVALLFFCVCFAFPLLASNSYVPPPAEGVVNRYDQNGNVSGEYTYAQGVLRRARTFHEKVMIADVEYDAKGVPIMMRAYYPEGKLRAEIRSPSPGDSMTQTYYEDGARESESLIKNNILMESASYYPNGKPSRTARMDNGQMKETFFDEAGNSFVMPGRH